MSAGGIPKFDTYEQLYDFEDVPVEQFAQDHTIQNVYETFFEPLLDAKFGDRKQDVSAAWLLNRVKFRRNHQARAAGWQRYSSLQVHPKW
jgi:protoporphyrinogen oxidase